jgi:hypothetical protein
MNTVVKSEKDRQYCVEHLQKLDLKHEYEVTIKRKIVRRTISQNKMLWLWYGCIIEETGNYHLTPEDLHEIFLQKYAPRKTKEFMGKEEVIIVRSSEMDKLEFARFIRDIEHDPASEGIILLYPEDDNFTKFRESYSRYIRG